MDHPLVKVVAITCATSIGLITVVHFIKRSKVNYARFVPMSGKTVIVTGANSGLGYETAKELVARKARVILACRNMKAAQEAAEAIHNYSRNGEVIVKHLDLASLRSVRQFVDEIAREEAKIDVLINNAGVYQCPYMVTDDGFEMQIGVNHLGHFLLTVLLLNKLKQSAPARVVIVSSALHKRGNIFSLGDRLTPGDKLYNKSLAYSTSKLANNLFARELAKRISDTGVCVYCLHPGIVLTNLARHVLPRWAQHIQKAIGWLLFKTPNEGCQTILHCATDPSISNLSGSYFGNCKVEPWSEVSLDDGAALWLWNKSVQLTGICTEC